MIATNQTASVANDIRDIKPPIEISGGLAWLWWTLAALVVLAAALLLWRWWQKRQANQPGPPPIPAHVRAKQKLAEALTLISQPKPFVIAVSDTARTYLEERFTFRAPERTTEEFLRELSGTDLLAKDQKESLGQFLQSCDLVKFAKYEPGEKELHVLHDAAVKLVEETTPQTVEIGIKADNTIINEPQPMNSPISLGGRTLAVLGTTMQLGNSVFFFAYAVGIVRMIKLTQDFSKQATHQTKIDLNNPLALVEEYFRQIENIGSGVLVASVIGVFIGLTGLVLIFIALIKQKYRAEWFFWFLAIYSVILLGVIPLGTVAGIILLVYCLTNRREFLKLK
jgi:hypothetical protein